MHQLQHQWQGLQHSPCRVFFSDQSSPVLMIEHPLEGQTMMVSSSERCDWQNAFSQSPCLVRRPAFTAIEVVEPSSYLQGIKYRQGLTSWKVVDDDFTGFTSFESPSADKEVDQPTSSLIPPKSAFPPSDTSIHAQLTRCVRMFPHDNDTGGFFIALLHKSQR